MTPPKGRPAPAAKPADSPLRFALFYGPELGLARERADTLAKTVVTDPADPFRVVALTGDQLAQDPARLSDEAAAIAFGGGRKVIRITDAPKGQTGQRQTQILKEFIEAPPGDALVIVEGGDLRKDHALVKAAEAARHATVSRCFPDDEGSLETVVIEVLGKAGLAVADDALAYLVDHLGGDRLLSRRELEKLAIYAAEPGRGKERPVTREEAAASVGDTAGLTYDDLCDAIAGGDRATADRCLTRLEAEGESPVGILRIVGRQFRQFHAYEASVAGGRRPDEALRQARVFGARAGTFQSMARFWQGATLIEAFRRLNEAEARCKSTGFPDWIVAARTLSALASMPRSVRR